MLSSDCSALVGTKAHTMKTRWIFLALPAAVLASAIPENPVWPRPVVVPLPAATNAGKEQVRTVGVGHSREPGLAQTGCGPATGGDQCGQAASGLFERRLEGQHRAAGRLLAEHRGPDVVAGHSTARPRHTARSRAASRRAICLQEKSRHPRRICRQADTASV